MFKVIQRFFGLFAPLPYVKIPGKDFDNLGPADIALMIEEFLRGDEINFDLSALYEFTLMTYADPFVESAKKTIEDIHLRNRTPDEPDGLSTLHGRAELQLLADRYRQMKG